MSLIEMKLFALTLTVLLVMGVSLPVRALELDQKLPPTVKVDNITTAQQNAEVARLLKEERFDELERYARDLITRKARFTSGGWRMYPFFSAMSDPYADNESGWKKLISRLERWRAAFPDSAISQTALGEGLLDWAIDARGEDIAAKVTDEGWRLFKERLTRAWQVLEQPVEGKDCPMRHTVRFQVAFLLNKPKEIVDKTYADAVQSEPQFFYNIIYRAQFLQPKWGGEKGQWARFLKQEMTRLDTVDRESFAARFAGNMVSELTYKQIQAEFPWDLLKPSFEKLVGYYNDPVFHNFYLRFACYNHDHKTVLRENGSLAGNVETASEAWRWSGTTYASCVRQAEEALNPKKPLAPKPPSNLLIGITWHPTDEAKVAGEKLVITNNGKIEAQVPFQARQDACVLVGASVTYSKPKAGVKGTPMFSGEAMNGKSSQQMLVPALLASPQSLSGSRFWWKTYPLYSSFNQAKIAFSAVGAKGEDKAGSSIAITNPIFMVFPTCDEAKAFGSNLARQ